MEYALPSSWGHGSRGFWTKRKKTATSLMAILALIAGIAVAFKLFDREVPNNVVRDASIFDFAVHVQRTASQGCLNPVQGGEWCNALSGDDPIFAETEFVQGVERPVSTFPGDSRSETVRIINLNTRPAKDATFSLYVKQDSIVVRGCDGIDPDTGECANTPVIPEGDPTWTRFINFWNLTVDKEVVLNVLGEEEYEPRSDEACTGGIREITPNSPCNLGTIRAAGTDGFLGSAMDTREYEFVMSEEDDGTDQSAFKGWSIVFDFVFQARLPALPDSSSPVHER